MSSKKKEIDDNENLTYKRGHRQTIKKSWEPRCEEKQLNSKCRLCGYRDEMVYHILSECCKLEQKENKTSLDSVGKVIHWAL